MLALFSARPVLALDPERLISQYGHTVWRLRDGVLPGPPYPITQTVDGYLWVGTQAGLLRFDGVRFVPLPPAAAQALPSPFIVSLLPGRDGSLWIGTSGGLSHWSNGELVVLPDTEGGAGSLFEDRDGAIWFDLMDARATPAPVCRIAEGRKQCFGAADGLDLPPGSCCLGGIAQDDDGAMLIASDLGVTRWRPGGSSVIATSAAKKAAGVPGALFMARGAQTWVGMSTRGEGFGLLQLVGDALQPYVTPQLDGRQVPVQALFVDRAGSVWIGTLNDGIVRIRGQRVDRFRAADGLSSNSIYKFFEDREGDIWVSTSEGVDRFRDVQVATWTSREGLGSDEADAVLAARDGTIWVGTAESLDAVRDGTITAIRDGHGLPGHQVTALLEDHRGRLWVGIDQTLTIYADGRFTAIAGVDGGAMGFVTGLAEDATHQIWARVPGKLVRIEDGLARDELAAPGGNIVADPVSGLWLGMSDGNLGRVRDGRIETIAIAGSKGSLRQLLVTPDGWVFGGGEAGLLGYKDGKQARLTTAQGLPCDLIHGLVFDASGALWLYARCGLLELDAAQLRQWWLQPDQPVHPRVLDSLDGVRPGRAPFRSSARAADGRLWFVNGVVLQSLDPAAIDSAAVTPVVHIEELFSDDGLHAGGEAIVLPPNPREVRIHYTAPVLSRPERVGFRYRLAGRNADWEDVGARREAFFTDLPPGAYRLEVSARYGGGGWSDPPAGLGFSIAPAWYQTLAFRVAVVLSAMLLLIAWYRQRVTRIAREMGKRYDERLAERTRLARDLHDTLLQTIQGSKMVADDALDKATDLATMRKKMERLAAWLDQAIQEGRAALAALRETTTQTNDLGEAFQRAAEECAAPRGITFSIAIHGGPRELHPIVRDEIYRVGYEAIRNACAHSGGSRLEVALSYGRDFSLRVRDNGRGFDVAAAEGRDGHFGLRGLRERAKRIEARLGIVSAPGSGTEVSLEVPGRTIFR